MFGQLLAVMACISAAAAQPAELVAESGVDERVEMAVLDLPGIHRTITLRGNREAAPLTVPSTEPIVYEIKAKIDGHDVLIIKQNMMQWHHINWQAVGRYEGANDPTTITTYKNGQVVKAQDNWFPAWATDNVHEAALSAVYMDLEPALPRSAMQVKIESIQCRGRVRVLTPPIRENDYTLKIEFDDNDPLGWDWYHIRVVIDSIDLSGLAAPAVASADAPHGHGRGYVGPVPCIKPPGFIDPVPYRRKTDSPLHPIQMKWWHLEDFEDGTLNTPGVAAQGGTVDPPASINANNNDSVDADDGKVDGFGRRGRGYYSAGSRTIRFRFDKEVLGQWPDCVGIVWTDVVHVSEGREGYGNVYFEAFDADGTTLGKLGPFEFGDGRSDGMTDEDRFFGVNHDSGVSAIEISMPASGDWEVDHLQYGRKAESTGNPGAAEEASTGDVQPGREMVIHKLILP